MKDSRGPGTGPYQLERSLSQEESFAALTRTLAKLGISWDFARANDSMEASHVELFDADGGVVGAGSGKGENHRLGALAEALEHGLLEAEAKNGDPLPEKMVSEVAAQPEFSMDYYLRRLSEAKDASVRVQAFASLADPREVAMVPLAYTNPFVAVVPNSAESEIKRYSTNSGTSLGLSFYDAYLHGLNEAVERHYLSLLFLELMGFKTGVRWSFMEDERVQRKQSRITESFGGEVLTVGCETEFSVHFSASFLIGVPEEEFVLTPIGSGCSFYPELALSRSVDELAQCVELSNDEDRADDRRSLQAAQELTKLRAIMRVSEEGLSRLVSAPRALPRRERLTTEEQSRLVTRRLTMVGYSPLYRTMTKLASGVQITQVFVPGLERFNLIRSGNLVAPQSEMRKK